MSWGRKQLAIAKNYLLPRVLKENGLLNTSIVYDDATLVSIIKGWCYYESGVRELQRCLDKISRKHAVKILENLQANNINLYDQKPSPTHSDSADSLPQEPLGPNAPSEDPQNQPTPGGVEPFEPLLDTADGGKGRKREATVTQLDEETIMVEEPGKDSSQRDSLVINPQAFEVIEQDRLVFDSANPEENEQRLKKYLGIPVFSEEFEKRKARKSLVGVCNVLTVSGFVGHVLTVEAVFDPAVSEKKGQLVISGNLKKVLQESVSIAKINAIRFLDEETRENLSKKNIHLHFMQGGMPKDGPSAGTAICTALISLLTGNPIPSTLGMTGELSLSGEVHKIGGLQAKVTACKTLGIKTILIPYGNAADWDEMPEQLKAGLEMFLVREYAEIHQIVFGNSAHIEKMPPNTTIETPSL